MGDEQEFDQSMCECVFSHEFAMRRLLSLLRNGQSVCTDNECTDLVQPQNASTAGSDSMDNFTFMIFMFVAAVILYLIRPNSLRRRNNNGAKSPRDDDSNDRNGPMVN